jgi:hypothetical protein
VRVVSGHDLDERGVAAPGVPVAMPHPRGFAQSELFSGGL